MLVAKRVAPDGREPGRAHLTVVSHGPDADHAAIAAGCNLPTVPRACTDTFAQDTQAFLSAMAAALPRVCRAVVVTDADELVPADPALAPGLAAPIPDRAGDGAIRSAPCAALREEPAALWRTAQPPGRARGNRGNTSGHRARGAGCNEPQIRRFARLREVPVREPAEVAAGLMRVGQGGSARGRRVVSARDGGRSGAGLAPMALPERFVTLASANQPKAATTSYITGSKLRQSALMRRLRARISSERSIARKSSRRSHCE